jgi:hypothetical protein
VQPGHEVGVLRLLIFFPKKIKLKFGIVVQLVRAPPCHGGSCGFETRQSRFFFDWSFELCFSKEPFLSEGRFEVVQRIFNTPRTFLFLPSKAGPTCQPTNKVG